MFNVIIFIAACGTSDPGPAATSVSTPAPVEVSSTPVTVATNEKATEALKVADAADGESDGVAHKCAGCALAMDGKSDHALTVDGTTLHLCAAACKEGFSKDVAANLESLLD
jgi:hypothetical protein